MKGIISLKGYLRLFFVTGIVLVIFILFRNSTQPSIKVYEKINGANLVGTPYHINSGHMKFISQNHIRWVSLVPYAFSHKNDPHVNYNHERQWWGEKITGISKSAILAREAGLKIMIKPHVWVRGDGWPGEFDLDSEEKWLEWEKNYTKYILDFADLADSVNADIFCLGTEFRIAVVKRQDYWRKLIQQIRIRYHGKITYAANWDNFHNIDFWEDLDFIGIDAYFPLSDEKTPAVKSLVHNWRPIKDKLSSFAFRYNKPILFTEFGYKSIDYNTSGHWKNENELLSVNFKAQANAYQAFFETFWEEDWVAGGFFWKWFPDNINAGGPGHKEFTPQNKDAITIVHIWYNNPLNQ